MKEFPLQYVSNLQHQIEHKIWTSFQDKQIFLPVWWGSAQAWGNFVKISSRVFNGIRTHDKIQAKNIEIIQVWSFNILNIWAKYIRMFQSIAYIFLFSPLFSLSSYFHPVKIMRRKKTINFEYFGHLGQTKHDVQNVCLPTDPNSILFSSKNIWQSKYEIHFSFQTEIWRLKLTVKRVESCILRKDCQLYEGITL